MTGTPSRSELPAALARLRDAARRRDVQAMQAEIDFAVAGIALIVHNMSDLAEEDREAAAQSGLAELESAGARADIAAPALETLADVLAQAQDVHLASQTGAARARAALHVPRIPPGLTPATRDNLARLAARAEDVGSVYEIPTSADDWMLALTGGGAKVAPVRLARNDSSGANPLRW